MHQLQAKTKGLLTTYSMYVYNVQLVRFAISPSQCCFHDTKVLVLLRKMSPAGFIVHVASKRLIYM